MLSQIAKFRSSLWLGVPVPWEGGGGSVRVCVHVSVCVHTTSSLSIDLSMDPSCFYILAIINNAIINIGVHTSFQINVFIFFR